MRKIKVLQFPIANSFGGITHYALDNWKWIDKEKFQMDFATMSKRLDFADEILAAGSKIHYISCYAEENRTQFIKEINDILDEGYDVVHLHTKQWKSFLVEEICKKHNIPKVIVHAHSTRCDANDDEKRELETKEHYRVREEFNESYATDFWACSEAAAEWLYGDRIAADKIKIMKNAIDTEKFIYNRTIREQIRKELGIENKFVVGTVGRMVYQKNQQMLLEAFAGACKKTDNLVLLIAGDGELRNELDNAVRRLEIEDKVIFLGKREDTHIIYQGMDIFVLPSRFEGLPITVIEAQAAGLYCLCSDVITQETDITGNISFLPLDEKIWADEIAKMPQYVRRDMSEVIKKAGYDINTQILKIENEYSKL